MSNKTFCMSPEDQVETTGGLFPHRGLQLALSSGNHYNNASPSPGASSPDSSRSMSNPSDRDTSSPPDVNMLECCLSEGSCGSNTYNTQTIASNTLTLSTLPEDNVLSGVSMNLNQTFIATAMNGSWDILNENLSLLMNTREMESEEVSKDAEAGGDRTTVTSPDSAERDSQLDPNKTSPGSSETGCCSLSSSEMVIRGDSFCLLDERLPVLSSLEESSISPAMDSAALIAEAGRLSATLPDVCKGLKEQISTEGVKRENTGPLCLGMTFTQADWELPAEENDIATSNSLVALPSEHEGGTLRTFIIEAALADSLGLAPPSTEANAEAILSPSFNESFTPGQGKTFMAPVSAMQDAGKEFQTSTPVQNIVSKMDSFPSFSESLCTGNRGSPVVHPAKQQQIPLTPKQRLIARLPPAARVNKMEIKKFPKPDFSTIKSKIVTRSAHQLAGQDRPPVPKTRPRCTSESSSTRPPKENKTTPSLSSTFTRAYIHLGQSKPGNLKGCTQDTLYRPTETRREAAENSTREVRKISLVAASSKSTAVGVAGARCDRNKSRFGVQPSSRMCSISAKGPPASQPLAASPGPRSASLPNRQRQGTLGRNECSTSKAIGTLQPKQRSTAANQRAQATEEPSLRAPSTTGSTKTSVNGSRPPHIPIRHTGPTSAPASRLPYKPQGVPRSLGASVHNGQSGDTGITQGGVAHRPTAFKSVVLRARLISTGRSTGPMDKNKPRASSQQQQPQQQAAQPVQSNGPPDLLPAANYQDQSLQQLRASNRRFEAMAVVLQQTLAKQDEATRQRRELSQELVTLRGELVCSVHSCERLEKDKEELHVALQDTLQNLQQQHQKDLAQLEERLQSFYQAEWDKVLLTYQEEADKCKALMEQQMGELKANHEAMKLETEASHSAQLQYVEQQCEDSLEELKKVHSQELQSLDKTLKEAEAALLEQIQERTVENNVLIEKLKAEENRRKELAEKNQKDSHTLYLEQELESLKVVLDIKNKQLHQQEKKLMQMDKMAEKNVKLDESFQRVQQENEDLKARMDRHAALSRQLSTEQAVLHESLQKESKVNKRLSMENEELLWKLHNGDPSSPRKSPTSPSHSLSFQSPRSPAMFSSPPVSPR
ncbi:microtubule-associated tumor suppressor 1 homolog A [Diretmus argenteus]